jgi:prophage regulatory protein
MKPQKIAFSLPAEGFVREAQLLQLVPVSSTTLWRMIQDKRFPESVQIYKRISMWRVADVRKWMDAQGQGQLS